MVVAVVVVVVVVVGLAVVVVKVVDVDVEVVVAGRASKDTNTIRFESKQGSTSLLLDILHSPVTVLNDTP